MDNLTDLAGFSMSTVLGTNDIVPFRNWLCYEWARRDPRRLDKSAALGTTNPNAWKNIETKTIGFRIHPHNPELWKTRRSTSLEPADSEYHGDVEEEDGDDNFSENEPTPLFLRQGRRFGGPCYFDNNPNSHNNNDRDSGCAVESYGNNSVPKEYLTIIC
jgi:hypothetical protein